MDNKSKILWITRTAVLIALLVAWQSISAQFGNQLITGSGVNLILIVSVMASGLPSGLVVAVLSPIMAKFFGIGPMWELIPFMFLGNLALVLLWHFIGGLKLKKIYISYIVALIVAAVGKFLTLYLGIVKIAVPVILKLPEPQATAISNTFSLPQLITATIGGVVAVVILPAILKAVKK